MFIPSFIFVVAVLGGLVLLGLYLVRQDNIITQNLRANAGISCKSVLATVNVDGGNPLRSDELKNWLKLTHLCPDKNYDNAGTYTKKMASTIFIPANLNLPPTILSHRKLLRSRSKITKLKITKQPVPIHRVWRGLSPFYWRYLSRQQ